jgi:hypothetical protein
VSELDFGRRDDYAVAVSGAIMGLYTLEFAEKALLGVIFVVWRTGRRSWRCS